MRNFTLHIFLALIILNCQNIVAQNLGSYIYKLKEGKTKNEWKVVWKDDFNKSELDKSKWSYIPANNADWGNYMSDDPQCYSITDGKIYLKGIVNPDTSNDKRPYLTGGIYSKGKFAFQYGKIEI